MIDKERRRAREAQKEKVRERIRVSVDPSKYRYIEAKKLVDYYSDDVQQRVAIYVRVSTDNVQQTTSYELQQKYYEDFVTRHPKWTLVHIYADEGISGTSMKKRDEFNRMIADCRAGKIDMIITKSVSRFARNVSDFVGTVRMLAELRPHVGVFFESEAIFSLNDDSQMALTFQATMAEEESHTRSRSMESSLHMRLDYGIPLTPTLYGYKHDANGTLVINEDEAPTVKLIFYMYLYGYSSQQIADTLIALERKSYFGLIKWTSTGVVGILRNERHCGDVLTRKTFTENYRTHRTLKNRGDKPQSWYYDHHTPIVSRDDFNAVQRMLDNAKYGNKSVIPELRVIEQGILKGFVVINPRWANFKEAEYYTAARSVLPEETEEASPQSETEFRVELEDGDFDLRGFEIARSALFDNAQRPCISFVDRKIKLNAICTHKLAANNYIEMLINPVTKQFAVRPTAKNNRNGVYCSKLSEKMYRPKDIPAAAFFDTVFSLFGWNPDCKYRIAGHLYEQGGEMAYIFNVADSEAYFRPYILAGSSGSGEGGCSIQPLTVSGKRIRAIPEGWANNFGKQFYLHEKTMEELDAQSEEDWQLRLEGQQVEIGEKLHVTGYDTLKAYIRSELHSIDSYGGTN